jgi:hypothetical protein
VVGARKLLEGLQGRVGFRQDCLHATPFLDMMLRDLGYPFPFDLDELGKRSGF